MPHINIIVFSDVLTCNSSIVPVKYIFKKVGKVVTEHRQAHLYRSCEIQAARLLTLYTFPRALVTGYVSGYVFKHRDHPQYRF